MTKARLITFKSTPEFDQVLAKATDSGLSQTDVFKGGTHIMAALSDAHRRAACGLAGADAQADLLKRIAKGLK
jgi:hypothetical protein